MGGSGELLRQPHPGIAVSSTPTAGPQPGRPLLTPAGRTPAPTSQAAAETVCLPISFHEGGGAEQAGSLDWEAQSMTAKETKTNLTSCPSCEHLGAPIRPRLPSPIAIFHTWPLHGRQKSLWPEGSCPALPTPFVIPSLEQAF